MKTIGQMIGTDQWTITLGAGDGPFLGVAEETDTEINWKPLEWKLAGYILPGDKDGGKIYATRHEAGTNSVAAWIKRKPEPQPSSGPDRVTALETAFVQMSNTIAAMHEQFSTEIKRIDGMIKDLNNYVTSSRKVSDVASYAVEAKFRNDAALAALPSVLMATDPQFDPEHAAIVAYRIADAMVSAAPKSAQVHSGSTAPQQDE